MADTYLKTDYQQQIPPRPPRIGGSALVGGVHLSTGAVGTGSNLQLFATGFMLIALGATASVLTYVTTWTIGEFAGVPLVGLLFQIATPDEIPHYPLWDILINLLTFLAFLVIVRLSPLSGYHAAEHKVVHAIEKYGYPTLETARRMPRAHRRCGTTLLAGILPAMLIAVPLMSVSVPLAVLVILLGWATRYPVGAVIQQIFTAKEPNERQLRAGLEAGRLLLQRWQRNPYLRVPPLQSLWRRGFVQMFAGVAAGMYFFGWIYQHLHIWLDWSQYLY